VKKKDAFEEWLCRRKRGGYCHRRIPQVFSTAGSAISVTEKFDPIAWSQPDIEEAFITLQHWAFDVSARLVISC
jgi:hypothetical protein